MEIGEHSCELLDDTAAIQIGTLTHNGTTKDVLGLWGNYFRPASKVDYDLAIGKARKRKDKELEAKDNLEVLPRRKEICATNYFNQQA